MILNAILINKSLSLNAFNEDCGIEAGFDLYKNIYCAGVNPNYITVPQINDVYIGAIC